MSEPVKGQQYIHNLPGLTDVFDPQFFKVNPTITVGDFKIKRDENAFANLTTTPTGEATSSNVKITISALEMSGVEQVVILARDQTGEEWSDWGMTINLLANTTDDVMDLLEGDHQEGSDNLKIFKKGTLDILLEKDITGSLLDSTVTVNTKEPVP